MTSSARAPLRLRFLPDPTRLEDSFVADYLRKESVGGMLAIVAAVIAIGWANSPWGDAYQSLRHLSIGPLDVEHWAADGLLAIFFFVAGLELKREFVLGSLSRVSDAIVPVFAAVCGVTVPALIFVGLNWGGATRGWAIPSATDIAFALAVLSVIGTALPYQLRAFLLTLAVVDDLLVIVIIALFYTDSLALGPLALAVLLLVGYAWAQRRHLRTAWLYLPLAAAAWWFTYESGIHATVAGVALGLLTRVRPADGEQRSPAERLERRIGPISSGFAVPVFALTSAGVVLEGGSRLLGEPIVWGVVLGLVIGKPLGVFGGSWLLCTLTRAEIDEDVAWSDVFGIAVLAGIGFTVSLLVSDLSFTGVLQEEAKTAVLAGSVISATVGAALLVLRNRHHAARRPVSGPYAGE